MRSDVRTRTVYENVPAAADSTGPGVGGDALDRYPLGRAELLRVLILVLVVRLQLDRVLLVGVGGDVARRYGRRYRPIGVREIAVEGCLIDVDRIGTRARIGDDP